jgi:hypothetical protein
MADYYPLLAKAIAGLDPNTPESRGAIYDRARSALLRQLAGIDPPVAQAIVERELNALEHVFLRLEQENERASEHAGPDDGPPASTPALEAPETFSIPPPPVKQRPQVKSVRPVEGKNRKPLLAVGLAVGAVVVFTLATLAFLRRDEPPATATRGVLPVQQAASSPSATTVPAPAKASDRVGAGATNTGATNTGATSTELAPVATPSVPVASAPVVQAPVPASSPVTSAPQPATPVTLQPPAIAVANRAILLLQAGDKDQPVVERQGNVVWRSEIVSAGQGQPADRAIKANVDIPEAKFQVEITIQRNRDTAFPASHTIQIRSIPAAGSEVGSLQGITSFELRQSQDQTGYAVAGQGITVVDNLFLIALSLAEPSRSRNEDMLKTRPLLYFEFPAANGKRGAVLLDKGISGQQAFDAAFASWQ